MRQVILDTETTGLSPAAGHRIIEIGCVELVHRRLTGNTFHTYLQPDRKVEPGAIAVHGITDDQLIDKPRFKQIAKEFKQFIKGAVLIIHNAAFDVGFIEHEFKLLKDTDWQVLDKHCQIIDTLLMARQKHPGQRNNLDALCKRYHVDNQHRDKHGALLDAQILADVYLAMTGGQNSLVLDTQFTTAQEKAEQSSQAQQIKQDITLFPVKPLEDELIAHEAFLDKIEKMGTQSIWRSE